MNDKDIWEGIFSGSGCFRRATGTARALITNWLADPPASETGGRRASRAEIMKAEKQEANGLAMILPYIGEVANRHAHARLAEMEAQGERITGPGAFCTLAFEDVRAGMTAASRSGSRLC